MKPRYLNDERGVVFIAELVLLAIVLGVIGFALYTVIHARTKPAPTANKTPLTTLNSNSKIPTGWKTYTNSATGLTFGYPSTLTPNINLPASSKAIAFTVKVQPTNQIPDATLWYGPDVAREEQAALQKHDLSVTSQGFHPSQLLSLGDGAIGASAMILDELACDDVRFQLEAHIYRNNQQIMIILSDPNVEAIKAANPKYFTINPDCTGDAQTKIWKNSETFDNFPADVAADKTDPESRKWYTTFQQVLSTISFQ